RGPGTRSRLPCSPSAKRANAGGRSAGCSTSIGSCLTAIRALFEPQPAATTSTSKTPSAERTGVMVVRTLVGVSLDSTKADDIALVIEEAIVSGELAPGTVLRQEQLSEQFKVSRTPIREALRRLAALGLVSF